MWNTAEPAWEVREGMRILTGGGESRGFALDPVEAADAQLGATTGLLSGAAADPAGKAQIPPGAATRWKRRRRLGV
nr:unnamed protein product [Digitaria exilis]